MNGHIQLFRRILTSDLWGYKSTYAIVALTCVLNARWKDGTVQGIKVKRGQWLTHYAEIVDKTPPDVTIKVARNALKWLASAKVSFLGIQLGIHLGRRFLLITICKYEEYQAPIGGMGTLLGTDMGTGRAQGGHDNNIIKGRKGRKKDVNALLKGLASEKDVDTQAIVADMIRETGDSDARGQWAMWAGRVPHQEIRRMLSVIKDARLTGHCDTPAALLVHLLKKWKRGRGNEG